METGKQRINDIFLINLADTFPIDIGDLFRTKSSKGSSGANTEADFISIPRFDIAASAGHGALAESEISTGHYAFNRAWLGRRGLNPATLTVIAVRGNSMEPELYDQDLILLDQSKKEPGDGDMYVVRYFDELFVKRIQKIPDRRFQLHSTNRFYNPIEVKAFDNNDLTFIGKVVASMHEW